MDLVSLVMNAISADSVSASVPAGASPGSGFPKLLLLFPFWLAGVVTLFGGAWLTAMLAPQRQMLAADSCAGWSRWLLGMAVVIGTFLVLVGLIAFGIKPVRLLVVTLLLCELAIGWSVAAMTLGRRVAPEGSAVMQTWLGLLGLGLPLVTPLGIPLLLVAAPMGLGAWLRTRV